MNTGIGVTTYNRPHHKELCLDKIRQHSLPHKFYLYEDTNKKGIAYGKNQCLKALKECEYIFLFDDDCFPIQSGWEQYVINTHIETGQHHFMYLKSTPTIRLLNANDERRTINIYDNCAGCFMFITKKVLDTVGGYCWGYGRYGYEHAGYSHRINKAGLTPLGKYTSPPNISDYICSMDFDFDTRTLFAPGIDHAPSLIDEIDKIGQMVKQNESVYQQDCLTTYCSLDESIV